MFGKWRSRRGGGSSVGGDARCLAQFMYFALGACGSSAAWPPQYWVAIRHTSRAELRHQLACGGQPSLRASCGAALITWCQHPSFIRRHLRERAQRHTHVQQQQVSLPAAQFLGKSSSRLAVRVHRVGYDNRSLWGKSLLKTLVLTSQYVSQRLHACFNLDANPTSPVPVQYTTSPQWRPSGSPGLLALPHSYHL